MKFLRWLIYRSWLVVAIGLHLQWGVSLIVWGEAASKVTAIATMTLIHDALLESQSHLADGMMLIVVSLIALLGLIWKYIMPKQKLLGIVIELSMLIPQQSILMMSAAGAVIAIYRAHYLDGTGPMPRVHLVNDQIIFLVLCIFHTINLLTVLHDDLVGD